MVKLLILNGPNLNLLGNRLPEIYGALTLKQLQQQLAQYVQTHHPQFTLTCLQANCEGALIDALQAARLDCAGVVFNPAAYTHYSYALRDAIEAIAIPVVEVHLTDIDQREDFRSISVVREVCAAHFQGRGLQSYTDAIDYLAERKPS
ncbi:MAG: 3-dehydroquinate dehydratase [Coriobacteriia bacterium]|nr:3-dehydroquinate dehydratase [Coriobacteriia bacterium]